MGANSSADLLFRIASDSTPAQADLAALRGAMGGTIAETQAGFSSLATGAEQAAERTSASTRSAGAAIRGLGSEIGVKMPRFVGSWLTSLGPVAGIMSAAFAPIAIIGLVEVLGKIPAALEKGIDWLHGWTEASAEAFKKSTEHALKWQTNVIEINERLRAIQLIGKDGADKWGLSLAVNSRDLSEVAKKLDELKMKAAELRTLTTPAKTPARTPEQSLAGLNLTGEITGARNAAAGPSHAEVERAKKELESLAPVIDMLEAKYVDLTLKGKELAAEAAADAKKVKDNFTGLSEVLSQVKTQMAGTVSEEAKVGSEIAKLGANAQKELTALAKAQSEHKLAPGVFDRETAAAQEALRLLPQLYQRLMEQIAEKRREEAIEQMREVQELKTQWTERLQMRVDNGELEAAFKRHEEAERKREQQAAFDEEMAALGRHLQQILNSRQTAAERIVAQYQVDVEKFAAAEEKKALLAATDEAQRALISARYAAIRQALLLKEGQDLQALRNSQGWQGVFGNQFAQLIRGNEALTREWASSTNQSLMMVRVTMEGLKEVGIGAFESLSQGMGANIAHAIIYKKSIGEAMRAALASTLENLAGQSIAYAIYSLALGFTRLAEHDPVGATSAFTAAAIWGSVGAAAALVGRAIAPAEAGAGAAAASGAGVGGGTGAGAAIGAGNAQAGPSIHITVNGNIFKSTDALIDAINEGVERGKTLTATNTTTGAVVYR